MKKIIFSCLLTAMLITTATAQYGTERTGYEGDYFSLEGAIELFRDSRSVNNFERKLNRQDSWVNNLDLNYDGEIDYVRVEHRNRGDFHAIILQAVLGRRDVQDVAVIEIERTGRRTAVLQIIGDADLYGDEVIAEPYNSNGYSSRGDFDFSRGFVNVYYWSAVQDMIRPNYVTYVSPYRWNYYPSFWSPWNQFAWNVYHPNRRSYYNRCHIVYVHRVVRVHNFYRPHRNFSRNFSNHARKHRRTYGVAVVHRSQGKNHKTYRANTRNNNRAQIQPRNSVSNRNSNSNRGNNTVSPRNTRSSDRVTSTRSTKQTRSSNTQIGRRESQNTNRQTAPRVNSQRKDRNVTRSSSQAKRSSATKSTRNSSANRSQTRQSTQRTQQRSGPTRTQTRKSTVKQQSRSSSPRTQSRSNSVQKRSTNTSKKSNSVKRSTSKKSSSRKGRGE